MPMGAPPLFPLLTRASRPLTFDTTAVNEKGELVSVSIAGEHPLTLYVDKREIVTLMTLPETRGRSLAELDGAEARRTAEILSAEPT